MTLPSELPPSSGPFSSEPFRCLIPAQAVGLIVGRNNTTVQQIRRESGAEIHVSGVRDTPPPLSDRIVTISGEVLQRTSAIRFIVHRLFQAQEVDDRDGIFVVLVPTAATHLLGSLQPSAAGIHVEDDVIGNTGFNPVQILGTLDQTVEAAALINDLLDNVQQTDGGTRVPPDFEPVSQVVKPAWASADGSGEEVEATAGTECMESDNVHEDVESDAQIASNKVMGDAEELPSREEQVPQQHLGTFDASDVPWEVAGRASHAAGAQSTATACRCLAPIGAIGLIIGKRGARLRQILKETGAVVTVSSDEDTPVSLSDRIVFISGNATQRDAACMHVIEKLFQAQAVMPGGQGMLIMLVPSCFVGSIMGSADSALATLCADSGACIELEEECIIETQDQPVRIVGTLEQCGAAASSIAALVQELLDDRGPVLSNGNGSFGTKPPLGTQADSRVGGLRKDGRRGEQLPHAAGVTRLALAPSTVMLINGHQCQLLLERHQNGKAVVEVSSTGESYHVVAIRGNLEARMHTVELLFGHIGHVSASGFREAALLVPSSVVGLLVGNGGRAIQEICRKSGAGAALTKAATPQDQLLNISGSVEALTKAMQLAATLVAEAVENRERGGTSATARPSRDRVGVRPAKSKLAARDDAQGYTSDPKGMPVKHMPSAASEDALLRAASTDLPDSSESQVMLLLPKEMAQKLLSTNGRVREIAERSGSRVELSSVRKVDVSSSQLLTLSGTRLGNSMAALYLQELLV
mmetsp:Transcript_123873/g.246516  ORF Transcript_123873/g.246516 Transcript_123873/m.246516 type:complete len:755 (-) Transcript_123873:312-2576(-)